MMKRMTIACLSAVSVLQTLAATLHSIAEINRFLESENGRNAFDVEACAMTANAGGSLVLADGEDRVSAFCNKDIPQISKGDRLRARGYASAGRSVEPWVQVHVAELLGKANLPPPADIHLRDLDSRHDNYREVRVTGTVLDVCADEVDPRYLILLLKDGESTLPVSCTTSSLTSAKALIDAKIRLSGIYTRYIRGVRKFTGAYISMEGKAPVEIIEPAPQDPFSVPRLETLVYQTPQSVAALGKRTVRGRVLAAWNGNRLMVRDEIGRIVNVELAEGVPCPASGECGIFAGYPTTDIFRINLSRAQFKRESVANIPKDVPETTTADALVAGNWHMNSGSVIHGRLLRLAGTVRSLPAETGVEQRMLLACGTHTVPVDISALRTDRVLPPLGSEVEVTGYCLLELDNWRTDNIFPHIRGFALLTRTADDIRVLRDPPWWTPSRLLTVIGVLLAGLVGFSLWNRSLHRLAERRGRALAKAQLAGERASLRTEERTRLAVELHDSISQNISGASMRVDAARNFLNVDNEKAQKCLTIASATLTSCREELRSCILDLRSRALEESDLNEAIRKTVAPYLNRAKLSIRFNVPRDCLSENTRHALMRIVRELVSNAIRHGHAATVAIAGTLDEGKLRFSVTDDGCGFAPEAAPSIAEGHFGLQGIRERVNQFGGEIGIDSQTGKGTRVKIWIRSDC